MPEETTVLPKSIVAGVVPTKIPWVPAPEILVLPKSTVPVMPERLMPCVPLLVLVTETKPDVAPKVPEVKLIACPLPLRVTSGKALSPMVSVPKPALNNLAPVVLPMVSPRTVLLAPANKVIALVAATVVVNLTIVPFALLVAGNAALYKGSVMPEIADRLAVASWPISFCPLSRLILPV